MHLLLAQKGTISDGDEAIDLGQSPGDILFLSAADTELAAVANACGRAETGPSLRLASLLSLKHPMSVDTYVERTARHARLIVVRALGGASYFQYALEALSAAARRSGALIAVLPGDSKLDPGVAPFSNVDSADLNRLWTYLIEGGDGNTDRFLAYARAMLTGAPKPEAAQPLPKAGIWWPGEGAIPLGRWQALAGTDGPAVAITFYKALVQSGETRPVEAMIEALAAEGLRPLPLFAYSLKDKDTVGDLGAVLADVRPEVVVNATGFAVSAPGANRKPTVLESTGAVVLQAIFSASSRDVWQASAQGLSARDLGMNVALPEVDGRVLSRAVSFKAAARFDERTEANIVSSAPDADRMAFVARLAANWARLARATAAERRVAIVMANYPNRDGRLGNGVGLDTPAGTMQVLAAMQREGYAVADLPSDGDALIAHLMAGPTNAAREDGVAKEVRETLSLKDYKAFFAALPVSIQDEVTARWGAPEADPFVIEGERFALPLARFGETLVGIQPARGYNIDPKETYHAPDLVPPHGYFAFYAFLRHQFGAHAIVHMGKHGNMEWLPGKALALSAECYPEAVFGPTPHLYPFIVNDPGEGSQAKRRSAAVIIGHLTPPLTRAESYGPLKDLEALVDEYYEASGGDPRRLRMLSAQILDLVRIIGLDRDAGIARDDSEDQALQKLDAYLCDLKEMQIRDGLHVFGVSPEGRLLDDLTVALARVPRGLGEGRDQSLQRAIAADLALGFDPLDTDFAAPWEGARPAILAESGEAPWRTHGDTVERIEALATAFVSGIRACPEDWAATRLVLAEIDERLRPSLTASGPAEIEALMTGLSGRFVPPGPSGAPTRGRPDVLPTGRNFYSVDSRAVPTPAAYELGRKSAERLITRYAQDHGDWPTSFGLTAWGTSNMRTGGDDIAQALALIGVKPVWDMTSRRVTGYEIIPMASLGRPRVDVTLRISGFFRDAFPEQIALFDRAIRAVGALDEDAADNPVAARMRGEAARLVAAGLEPAAARRRAGFRVFGSKPGAYGAGLQSLMNEAGFEDRADLAEAYLVWGSYAYGADEEGSAERGLFEERLKSVEAVVQNQDNREHDILDSDDYYQFQGGMFAAVESVSGGAKPSVYHNDHSRPETPVVRSLSEEIGRVVRGRAANPKWIAGAMRHGYKGGAEIAATVDFLFAYAATTDAVGSQHFDALYDAYLRDETVRDFMADKNPQALADMAERFLAALARGYWTPRSNTARFDVESLARRAAYEPGE